MSHTPNTHTTNTTTQTGLAEGTTTLALSPATTPPTLALTPVITPQPDTHNIPNPDASALPAFSVHPTDPPQLNPVARASLRQHAAPFQTHPEPANPSSTHNAQHAVKLDTLHRPATCWPWRLAFVTSSAAYDLTVADIDDQIDWNAWDMESPNDNAGDTNTEE